jgi:hypothetical protein
VIGLKEFDTLLSQEQRETVIKSLNRAEEIGVELVIVDAQDVWHLIPAKLRAGLRKPE